MKKSLIITSILVCILASLLYFRSCTDNGLAIYGEYKVEDLIFLTPVSSMLFEAVRSKVKDTSYILKNTSFSEVRVDNTEWLNVVYKVEEIDSDYLSTQYFFPVEIWNEILFTKTKSGQRYIIYNKQDEDIGYHIFVVGNDVYIGKVSNTDTFQDLYTIVKVNKIQ